MTYTPNYGLGLPDGVDLFNVETFNTNNTTIDTQIKVAQNMASQCYTSAQMDQILEGYATTAVATLVSNGLMSNTDKVKVNSLPTITRVYDTLTAGETEISFTNSAIKNDSYFQVHTSILALQPTDMVRSEHTVTLTFTAQESDITVELWVENF